MDLTRSLVPSSAGYFCVLRFDSGITTASDVHTKATLHFSSLVRDIIHVAANSYGDGTPGGGGGGGLLGLILLGVCRWPLSTPAPL